MTTTPQLWTRHPAPPGTGHATCRDSTGQARAIHTPANILSQDFDLEKFFADLPADAADTPLILPSGTVEAEDGDLSRIATWSATGWDALAARSADLARASRPIWLRPAVGTVLSDAQRCRKYLTGLPASSPIQLVLDPAALIEPSMLGTAEDHLARILDTLLDEPRVAALMLTDLDPSAPLPPADPIPLGRGGLPIEPLRAAAAAWSKLQKGPVILPADNLSEQTAALGLSNSASHATPR